MPKYIVSKECSPHVYRNGEFYKVGETFTVHEAKDLHIKFVPADREAWDYAVVKFGSAAMQAKHGPMFITPETPPAPPPVVQKPVVVVEPEPQLTTREFSRLSVMGLPLIETPVENPVKAPELKPVAKIEKSKAKAKAKHKR
jgi:hypothetical protein